MPAQKPNENKRYNQYLMSFLNKRIKLNSLKRHASTVSRLITLQKPIFKLRGSSIEVPLNRASKSDRRKYPILQTFRPSNSKLKKNIRDELDKRQTLTALKRITPVKQQENPEYKQMMKQIRELEEETSNKMTVKHFRRPLR